METPEFQHDILYSSHRTHEAIQAMPCTVFSTILPKNRLIMGHFNDECAKKQQLYWCRFQSTQRRIFLTIMFCPQKIKKFIDLVLTFRYAFFNENDCTLISTSYFFLLLAHKNLRYVQMNCTAFSFNYFKCFQF